MRLQNLRAEMARSGITNFQLAEELGVRAATVSDKINGRSRFFCDEAIRIKRRFFPSLEIDYLFEQNSSNSA